MAKCQLVLYIIFGKHSINTVILGKQIVSRAFFGYCTAESDLGLCSVFETCLERLYHVYLV